MVDKSLLEQLRGRPIGENTIRGIDIPCNETSDSAALCRRPLVSVPLVTYNHGKYLRRCLESVVSQRTDFEFEVVIGEDCSQDDTRDICFEFQRRYPDRVRVLWSEENVYLKGGNINRVLAHCRGDYLAFLEGDDYWTDDCKLQKQIGLMRRYPEAVECFAGVDFLEDNSGRIDRYDAGRAPKDELMSGREFQHRLLFRRGDEGIYLQNLHTSGYLVRRDVFDRAAERFGDIARWKLRLADFRWFISGAAFGDVCFLREPCSVYRMNDGGTVRGNVGRVMLDGDVVKFYFAMELFGLPFERVLDIFADRVIAHYAKTALKETSEAQRQMAAAIAASPAMAKFLSRFGNRFFYRHLAAGRLTRRTWKTSRLPMMLFSHLRFDPLKGIE